MRSVTIGILAATLFLAASPASARPRSGGRANLAQRSDDVRRNGTRPAAADLSRRPLRRTEEAAPWAQRHRTTMLQERVVASRFSPGVSLYARIGREPTSLREVLSSTARPVSSTRQILTRRAPSAVPQFSFRTALGGPEESAPRRLFAFNQVH